MPSIDYDLRYLTSALPELESYLLSSDLYWPVGVTPPPGEPAYPSLTIGNALLAWKRLESQTLSPDNDREYRRLSQDLDGIRMHWRHAWEHKAAREFRARLNLWRDYLEDYRADPEGNIDRYAYEVHRRVELELLSIETDAIHLQEAEMLQGLDMLLEVLLEPGNFIWDPELAGGFEKKTYWFLFGKPKVPKAPVQK